MNHTTTRLFIVAALVLAACGGDDSDDPGNGDRPRNAHAEETTTTEDPTEPERQAVIAARTEAQRQREHALRNPSNPENPALRDHFTDTELLRLINYSLTNSAVTLADGHGIGVFIGAIYPDPSVHRFDIGSVTLSADRTKAWLETCTVEDYTWHYLNDDMTPNSRADLYNEGLPAVRTTQATEEMWHVDGRWKLAKTFPNIENANGQVGCAAEAGYAKDHDDQPSDAEVRQAITDARAAAETESVAYLTDPAFTAEAATHWGGLQHALNFGTDQRQDTELYCPADPTLIYSGPSGGTPQQFYMIEDAQNPWKTNPYYAYPPTDIDESPCYADHLAGQQSWAFQTRASGSVFDPATTSATTVQDVTLQAVATPQVAYLTTCRAYNLIDGADWDLAPYYVERGLTARTVTAFEVMHLVDGTWKLTNRWGFTDTTAC